ncbi:hypothetical protein EH221_04135, partial [bacterium]
RQWRFVRLVHRAESLSDNELTVDFPRLKEVMQIRRLISIKSSSSIAAPVVWGFFRPILLLPPDFCRFYSRSQMRWILLHELAHIRRFDTMAATLQKIMQIFFFFHPVIWLTNWIIDQQREYACDDMALMSCGASRMECGKGFLALVQRMNDASMIPPNATTLGLIKYHTQIRRRMMRMLDIERKLHGKLSFKSLSFVMIMAVIAFTLGGEKENDLSAQEASNVIESDETKSESGLSNGSEIDNNSLSFRKISSDFGGLSASHISWDGRYMTGTDWDNGNLVLRDISTGRNIYLTQDGSWGEPRKFVWYSAISPGNQQIAYGWYSGNQQDLCLIGIDGSNPRVLINGQDEKIGEFEIMEWSPDGENILVRGSRNERTDQNFLAWISSTDGSIQILHEFGEQTPGNVFHSPDGRFIAYDFPKDNEPVNRDIYILDVEKK